MFSSDGREHPITGLTPIAIDIPSFDLPDAGAQVAAQTPSAGGTSVVNAGGTLTQPSSWLSWLLPSPPQHFAVRAVVGVIAIGIVLIVALRLTK